MLLPVALAQAQAQTQTPAQTQRAPSELDNAAAYALANQVADELELVRERMGRPYDDSPRLPVSAVSELELYFQTQSLLRKANQLAQELAGAAPRSQGPVPSGEISPDDVYALLDDSLAQIRLAAEAIGITERATFDQRVTSIAATGVFLVVIDINRQLNQMLRVPISDAEVFAEVSAAITSAAALLATYPGTTPVPEPPPFDGYKRPADVYERLTECMDAVIRVAPKIGVPVLGLSARRNVTDDTDARPCVRHRTLPRRRSHARSPTRATCRACACRCRRRSTSSRRRSTRTRVSCCGSSRSSSDGSGP